MIVYTAITLAAISAIPSDQLPQSGSPLAHIVENSYGGTGAVTISVIALFSTNNTILFNMLGSSRVLLSVGKEIKLLRRFSYVSPKKKTPVAALVLILIVTCLFALIGKLETIAMIANLSIFTTFLLVNIALIVLRRKAPSVKRPYRIPMSIKNLPVFSVIALLLVFNVYGFSAAQPKANFSY